MQIGEIISDVRSELVEANASFWSDAELLALANRAQRDFVQKTRCLEDKALISTVTGQQSYVLPSTCLSVMALFVNANPTGVPSWQRVHSSNLERISQINQNHPSNDSSTFGTPSRYWLWNNEINFDPIPDTTASSNVLIFFKAKPTALVSTTSDILLDDSLSEALNNFMLWKAWKKEQESDKAAEYLALYEMNVKQGLRFVKKLSGDERKRIDIESARDFDAGDHGFNPFK